MRSACGGGGTAAQAFRAMAHGVTGPGGAGGNAPVTRASGVAARHTSPAGEFAGENASGCAR